MKVHDITIWKIWTTAIWLHVACTIEVSNVRVADIHHAGILLGAAGPKSVEHVFDPLRRITVEHSLLVAESNGNPACNSQSQGYDEPLRASGSPLTLHPYT